MSDQRALLAAICAHPDEDTPRLMYADWLDDFAGSMPAKKRESVRMRAELIRAQCELARLPTDEEDAATATRRVELELRQEELLKNASRRKSWAKPLQPPPAGHEEFTPSEHHFIRGFPEFAQNAYAETNGYLTVGESLFNISPVHAIDCRNVQGEDADRFLALPWLGRVRRLSIGTNLDRSRWEDGPGGRHWVSSFDGTDVATTEKLFAAPALANLEELELRSWEFGEPGAPVVGCALTSLKTLHLWGGIARGPASFRRLGELLPPQLGIKNFELDSSRYGAGELRELFGLPQLQHVERLRLTSRFGEVWWQPQPLGVEGVRAITSAPCWPRLRAFCDAMGRTGIAGAEIGEFAAAPASPDLRTLELVSTDLGTGVALLARSPLLASVTTLDLSGTTPGDLVASHLAQSPHAARLLSVKLNDSGIEAKGVKSLAESPFAENLVRLELKRCPLRKAAVEALVAPGNFPQLRRLDVSGGVRSRAQRERLLVRFGKGVRF